jgi:chromosome segregation protein
MLKRLELVGFKSFADKTRFDFHTGITAIVGPNGSGKSNIVDAVKWILGEQSAKSLRGGEMADVIFNGSATRKSLGMAEVTMTFANDKRILNTDGEEVQITRRVYRDGTGEYLINGQISRLKDIKDLFLGSGAGSATYCIIEQGRVDALLQASTADRRAIFEEAAGISRFKAKKNETLRKLEHVDQNLEQLRLIIGEVEKQHRKASMEANKAKKYLEYTDRLKYLRIGMGTRDYQLLSGTIQGEQQEVEILRSGLTVTQVQASEWEAEAYHLEQQLRHVDVQFEEVQNTLSSSRQQIATCDSTLQHEWTKITSLEEDLTRTRQSKNDLSFHLRLMQQSVQDASTLVIEVEKQSQEQQDRVEYLGN